MSLPSLSIRLGATVAFLAGVLHRPVSTEQRLQLQQQQQREAEYASVPGALEAGMWEAEALGNGCGGFVEDVVVERRGCVLAAGDGALLGAEHDAGDLVA
ncbi:MAG: hypothetical protein L6R41_000388 [Letrouitia leprolyta]|nr:MAG: hypothetical protein L6R41_000388 [Letrouitia leprolyta]